MAAFFVNLTREGVEDQRFQHENLGILYLMAALETDNIAVDHVDCQLHYIEQDEIIDKILKMNPLLVGITVSVQALLPYIMKFCKKLRARGYSKHITFGGVFASIEAVRLLELIPEIDSVEIGEGEEIIKQLYHALEDNADLANVNGLVYRSGDVINKNKNIQYNKDLDVLGTPSRADIKYILQAGRRVSLVASRGCVSNCIFCSSQSLKCLGIPRRQRSAASVVAEMMDLNRKYGVTKVKFNDPVFIQPGESGKKWSYEFREEIEKTKCRFDFVVNLRALECLDEDVMQALADAGLTKVVLGVESGSDRILKWMRKPTNVELNNKAIEILKKCGIEVEICYIFFVPIMDLQDLLDNINFLRLHNAITPFALTSILEVYNGSIAEKVLEEDGKLIRDEWWQIGSFEFYESTMKAFWSNIQPVLSEFNKVIDELYLCDIVVQKYKNRTLSDSDKNDYNNIIIKSGKELAMFYEKLVYMIRRDESDYCNLYSECEKTVQSLLGTITELKERIEKANL